MNDSFAGQLMEIAIKAQNGNFISMGKESNGGVRIFPFQAFSSEFPGELIERGKFFVGNSKTFQGTEKTAEFLKVITIAGPHENLVENDIG